MAGCPDRIFQSNAVWSLLALPKRAFGLPYVPPFRLYEPQCGRQRIKQSCLHLNAPVRPRGPFGPWRQTRNLPKPARSSLEMRWPMRRPNASQARAGRLSSALFPFSVYQPILDCGLRPPASKHSRFDVWVRPCGFVEPLLFARVARCVPCDRGPLRSCAAGLILGDVPLPEATDIGLVDPTAFR